MLRLISKNKYRFYLPWKGFTEKEVEEHLKKIRKLIEEDKINKLPDNSRGC
jgi:hypothetical protein